MFADKILAFYRSLEITTELPEGVEVMNPYQNIEAFSYCSKFYKKFYNDNQSRTIILGINPGRFGGGLTGVPFTDPIKLEGCGIPNPLQKKAELSADFIYTMIRAFGGADLFYKRYFFSAASPLGFIKNGKNLNYYDIPELLKSIEPFIVDCVTRQLEFDINTEVAFCLGEGDNFKYLNALNKKFNFFKAIEPLPHPRFIMQYRRKRLDEYIGLYLEKLK